MRAALVPRTHRRSAAGISARFSPRGLARILVLGAAFTLGCSDRKEDAGIAQATSGLARTTVLPTDPSLAVAARANNDFGMRLFAQVRASAANANVLTSPISASLALGMAYGGAKGQMATEMASALGVPPGGDAAFFTGQNALSAALATRAASAAKLVVQNAEEAQEAAGIPDFALDVVNSVWGQRDYPWSSAYLDLLAQSYGTGIDLQDFRADLEPARVAINGWVSDRTRGLIRSLLVPGTVDATTRMLLVNAVSLKFAWANPVFDTLTAAGAFTRPDGTTVTARFMSMGGSAYAETDAAQTAWVSLAGYRLQFFVALPKGDLATYEASLTTAAPLLPPRGSSPTVNLHLPKFDVQPPAVSLKSGLQALGMVQAFDAARADFTGACTAPPDGERLHVGDVLQQATMAVDEKGLTASAATAVILGVGGEPNEKPVEMRVDRSFVIGVIDADTQTLLFLGHVTDPSLR